MQEYSKSEMLVNNSKVFVVFFCLFLVSCTKVDRIKVSTKYSMDISDKSLIKPDSSLFESVEYIPLESTTQSLIGEIHKILAMNNTFYILDRQFAKAIKVFDSKGKFQFEINKLGKGPGEYLYIYDFDIDAKGNIYVLDLGNKKVIKYNSKGGFIEEFQLKFNALEFAVLDSVNFAFFHVLNNGEVQNNISIFNKTTQENQAYFPYRKFFDDSRLPFTSKFHFYRSNAKINFSLYFSDIVYSIESKKLLPYMKVESFIEPSSELNLLKQNLNSKTPFTSKNIKLIKDIYENDDLIVFSTVNNNSLIYSKTTHKIIENIFKDKRYIGSTSFLGVYEDKFITYVDPNIASYMSDWEQCVKRFKTDEQTRTGLLNINKKEGITYLILVKFKKI